MSLYAWTTTLDGSPLTVQVAANDAIEARRSALEYLAEIPRIGPQRLALNQQMKDAILLKQMLMLDRAMVSCHRESDGLAPLAQPVEAPVNISEQMKQMRMLEGRIPANFFGGKYVSTYQFNFYTADMMIGENSDISLGEFIKNTDPACL